MAVYLEKEGAIATVILDRKEVCNAVDRQTAAELAEAFREVDDDPEVCVGIFYGEHGHFCTGADLKAIAAGTPNRIKPTGEGPMGPSRMMMSKPVIAAITGHAVAGGLELALWCDMRVIEADAVLGVYCRRWGVPLIDGGTVRLPRIVGLGNAMDMILTGRGVTAEEALRMGLVNRVVPRGMALQAARDIAMDLSMFPQACMRNDRMSVYESLDLEFDAAMANEFRRGQDALKEETLEGAQRFANRKIRPVQ